MQIKGPVLYWYEITSSHSNNDIIRALKEYKQKRQRVTPVIYKNYNRRTNILYVGKCKENFWGRIIAAPKPMDIYEIDAVRALLDAGQVVIAAGGGGIPVLEQRTVLKGASAIIEKDYVAARLAELIDADTLLFLTEGDKLVINADNDNRKEFDTVKADELKQYVNKNNLGEITTLPKVDAAVGFVLAGEGRKAVIANLEKAKEALAGKTGTTII
jgi:carbamate kinase